MVVIDVVFNWCGKLATLLNTNGALVSMYNYDAHASCTYAARALDPYTGLKRHMNYTVCVKSYSLHA